VLTTSNAYQTSLIQLIFPNTGFTGRLITRYLSTHPQRPSFTFSLAARSKSKLDALVTELSLKSSGALAPDHTSVGVRQVNVTNFDEVEAAVRSVKVVINTVGPYWTLGTPIVRYVYVMTFLFKLLCGFWGIDLWFWYCRACVRHGVHYVDLSGDTPWIRDIITECVRLVSFSNCH